MKRYILYKDGIRIGRSLTFEALQAIINDILDNCDGSYIVQLGVATEIEQEEFKVCADCKYFNSEGCTKFTNRMTSTSKACDCYEV